MGPHEDLRSPLLGGQSNTEGCRVPQLNTTPKHRTYTVSSGWLWGTALGFYGFEPHHQLHSPVGFVPSEWGEWITEQAPTPGRTTLQRSENQRTSRELKKKKT